MEPLSLESIIAKEESRDCRLSIEQEETRMDAPQIPKTRRFSMVFVAVVIVISMLMGGLLGYAMSYATLNGRLNDLQNQLSTLSGQNATYVPVENISYFLNNNVSLSELYSQVKESVVVVLGQVVTYDMFHRPYYSQVQGSGFVYNATGQTVVVTNYHVVESAINISVTFADGNAYSATVLGSDAYGDLAVLSTDAPESELKPLEIVSSSTLEVGNPVIAVGNPYGLAGSMTTGIVSALGRTISEETTGGYPIASVIQTSTPINPGNSGGPLLNYRGEVVGITTAIVSNSQGLGFAIPSSTILREIGSLMTSGSYNQHPWLGATGTDMTYDIAQAMGTNTTFGWLVATVTSNNGLHGGTKQVTVDNSIVTIGGDIIVGIDRNRIMNLDDLSTYLEEHTQPGQTVNVTIVRSNETMSLGVTLGTRPALSVTSASTT
jgi:S1-C subfamily serine protease